MKLIPRHSRRTRLIVAVIVAAEFIALAVLAVEVRVFHRGGSLTASAVLLLGIVCGLNYLRSRRDRP